MIRAYLTEQASNVFLKVLLIHKPTLETSRNFQAIVSLSENGYSIRCVTKLMIFVTKDIINVSYLDNSRHEVKCVRKENGDVEVYAKIIGNANNFCIQFENCATEGAIEVITSSNGYESIENGYSPFGYVDDIGFIQIEDGYYCWYMRKNGYATVLFDGKNKQLSGGGTMDELYSLPDGYKPIRPAYFNLLENKTGLITADGKICVTKETSGASNYIYGTVTFPISN